MSYTFLRALASGPWPSVDVHDERSGEKIGERTLVMAMEQHGRWNVDNRPVLVEPGLVVSFANRANAEWFLEQDRARWIIVEPGMCLAFESESDAQFFIRLRLGERITQAEAEQVWGAAVAAHNGVSDGEDPDQGADPDPSGESEANAETETRKQGHEGRAKNKGRSAAQKRQGRKA